MMRARKPLLARMPHVTRGDWLLSFADLLALVLCMLVLQFMLVRGGPERQAQVLSDIRNSFADPRPVTASPTALQVSAPARYWQNWFVLRLSALPALAGVDASRSGNRVVLVGAGGLDGEALRQLAGLVSYVPARVLRSVSPDAAGVAGADRVRGAVSALLPDRVVGLAVDPGVTAPSLELEL